MARTRVKAVAVLWVRGVVSNIKLLPTVLSCTPECTGEQLNARWNQSVVNNVSL